MIGSLLSLSAHVSPAASAPGTPIGWKAGLGGAATVRALNLRGALVGRLTADGHLSSGAAVSISGWLSPRLEPEIAVRVGRDLAGDESDETVVHAIAEAFPAFELVDVTGPLDDVPAVLAANIYQRAIVLGAPAHPDAALRGAVGMTLTGGSGTPQHIPRASDAIGDLADVVAHVARAAAAAGTPVRAGQLIMTGSLVTPVPLAAPAELVADFGSLGQVSVRIVP